MPCLQPIRDLTIRTLLLALCMSAALSLLPLPALALDAQNPPPDTIPTLAPVTVIATVEKMATGQATIDREDIERLPGGNGSINELLRVLPGVQLGEKANSSLTGGEILPPNVSISGGKVFQNNFLIDGIGNNSLLDPAGDLPESVQDVPGHPQELFIDPGIVESITVHTHNIPVEFGGFTGGVVDTKTRDPRPFFGGKVDFRTTRNTWTEFHVADEEEFEHSDNAKEQPVFRKYDAGLSLDIPLNEKMGLLASYRRIYSKIPLENLDRTENQERRLETFFLKYLYEISALTRMDLSLTHSPYRSDRFRENFKDSEYRIEGGGSAVKGTLRHLFDIGELEINAAFSQSENSRKGPQHYRTWMSRPADRTGSWSKDWGSLVDSRYSKEGGYGDLETTQEGFDFKASLTSETFATGALQHEIKAGFDLERIEGTFERKDLSYRYILATADENVICEDGSPDCVSGEQFLSYRQIYEPDAVSETVNLYGIYGQDSLRYKRLEVRPGLRISRDDLMKNTNLAPRLSAALDLFGNGETVLTSGWNRYYGKTLLTYKLAEAKKPYNVEKIGYKDPDTKKWVYLDEYGSPLPWSEIPRTTTTATRFSELKNPFADEVTIGINQALLGGRLELLYMERKGEDELASENSEVDDEDHIYITLNNNGSSRHEEYRIAWEREWSRYDLTLDATYQETSTSHGDYREVFDDTESEKTVWYEGEVIGRNELPRQDYSRPWVANLTYSVELPYGFTFTNFTKYRGGYEGGGIKKVTHLKPAVEAAKKAAAEVPADVDVDYAYLEEKQPESWIFDWKLDWRRRTFRDQELTLSLEAYNVFNEKVLVGGEEDEYELGRSFWAGMEYIF